MYRRCYVFSLEVGYCFVFLKVLFLRRLQIADPPFSNRRIARVAVTIHVFVNLQNLLRHLIQFDYIFSHSFSIPFFRLNCLISTTREYMHTPIEIQIRNYP